jgi:hypothetical protein
MATLKVACPTCNLVFAADHPAAPVVCPVCDTRFTPAELPARTAHFRRIAVALAVLALLAGGTALVLSWPGVRGGGSPTAVHAPKTAAAPESEAPVWPEVVADPRDAEAGPAPPPSPPPPRPPLVAESSSAEPAPSLLAEAVNRAIDRGLAYLRQRERHLQLPCRPQGLLGLTLLECGVPPTDPFVERLAASLREQAAHEFRTYELSTTIFFLDRLGAPQDDSLIRALAGRLRAGQTADGAWTYTCVSVTAAPRPTGTIVLDPRRRNPQASSPADHSNTQFATLALWIAQRHGAEVRGALARLEAHFRQGQGEDGSWAYRPRAAPFARPDRPPARPATPARRPQAQPPRQPTKPAAGQYRVTGTCAGLLALAVTHGIDGQIGRDARAAVMATVDEDIAQGLDFLGEAVAGAAPRPGSPGALGLDGRDDLYTLWSLERTATVYDLRTLGGRPWYPWAATWLVATQAEDGSWRHILGADVDTCFALLVLRRSNLTPDLTAALRGRLAVPGQEPLRAGGTPGERTAPPPSPEPIRAAPAEGDAPAAPEGMRAAPADERTKAPR